MLFLSNGNIRTVKKSSDHIQEENNLHLKQEALRWLLFQSISHSKRCRENITAKKHLITFVSPL